LESTGTTRSEALLAWYHRHGRSLPWRTTTDPWSILVSEVMLQQTQAARVIPHYRRFMEQYPTPAVLAGAALSEVLSAWSGLGYNRRALALRDAAEHITNTGWPRDAAGLQSLPGVGPYTAAAVACFAFGEQLPAIDTNVRRVLSRWTGRAMRGRQLEEAATTEIAAGRAADWNQAMMDLGSLVCRPRNPHCDDCPVSQSCTGPGIYVPPRPQGTFRGSRREARGAVIKTLVEIGTTATFEDLTTRTGLATARLDEALRALAAERFISADGDRYSLRDMKSAGEEVTQ
jgi:A/G-specific adenine glycosylase